MILKKQKNNFRPVLNLSFLSCQRRLSSERKQTLASISICLLCLSTETDLLRVLNDLLTANDDGQVSPLVLLDLSTAFHTTDRDILHHQIEHVFGIHFCSFILPIRSYWEKANSIQFWLLFKSLHCSSRPTTKLSSQSHSVPTVQKLLSHVTDRHSVCPQQICQR